MEKKKFQLTFTNYLEEKGYYSLQEFFETTPTISILSFTILQRQANI